MNESQKPTLSERSTYLKYLLYDSMYGKFYKMQTSL